MLSISRLSSDRLSGIPLLEITESDSDTVAEVDKLIEADSDVEILDEVLIESDAIMLSISRLSSDRLSGIPLLEITELDSEALAEADADADSDALTDSEALVDSDACLFLNS